MRYRVRSLEGVIQRLAAACRPTPAPAPRRLQTAQDVIDLLQEQVEALRRAPALGALEKARGIGHLAAVARKAIETGTLASRVEMLEAVLQQRAGGSSR